MVALAFGVIHVIVMVMVIYASIGAFSHRNQLSKEDYLREYHACLVATDQYVVDLALLANQAQLKLALANNESQSVQFQQEYDNVMASLVKTILDISQIDSFELPPHCVESLVNNA